MNFEICTIMVQTLYTSTLPGVEFIEISEESNISTYFLTKQLIFECKHIKTLILKCNNSVFLSEQKSKFCNGLYDMLSWPLLDLSFYLSLAHSAPSNTELLRCSKHAIILGLLQGLYSLLGTFSFQGSIHMAHSLTSSSLCSNVTFSVKFILYTLYQKSTCPLSAPSIQNNLVCSAFFSYHLSPSSIEVLKLHQFMVTLVSQKMFTAPPAKRNIWQFHSLNTKVQTPKQYLRPNNLLSILKSNNRMCVPVGPWMACQHMET